MTGYVVCATPTPCPCPHHVYRPSCQAHTRCAPASSSTAAGPQQAEPPSPEPRTAAAAGTPPSAASGRLACLHLESSRLVTSPQSSSHHPRGPAEPKALGTGWEAMTCSPLSGVPLPGPLLCDCEESWARNRLDAMAKGTLVLWTGGGRRGT